MQVSSEGRIVRLWHSTVSCRAERKLSVAASTTAIAAKEPVRATVARHFATPRAINVVLNHAQMDPETAQIALRMDAKP